MVVVKFSLKITLKIFYDDLKLCENEFVKFSEFIKCLGFKFQQEYPNVLRFISNQDHVPDLLDTGEVPKAQRIISKGNKVCDIEI